MAQENERILMLVNHYSNGNRAKFASLMNVSAQQVNYWRSRTEISNFVANKICTRFPEVSKDWLLTGNGDMFTNGEQPKLLPQSSELSKILEITKEHNAQIANFQAQMTTFQAQASRYQDQIDRLLSIVESFNNQNKPKSLSDVQNNN